MRKKRALFGLLITVLSASIALVAGEMLLIAMDVRPSYQAYWKESLPHFEFQPDYLYRVRPNASPEFNADGYRGPATPAKSSRKRLLALGDSFFMGLNVSADQTLPSALGRRLGERYEVLNMGVYGYGPDQLLARQRAEGVRYQADALLLGLYAENDFNDLNKNRVFEYGSDGSLTLNRENPVRTALPSTRLEVFLRRAFTGHFLAPELERELAVLLLSDRRDILSLLPDLERRAKIFMMRAVLAAFAADARASGVPIYVVVIPALVNVQDPAILLVDGVKQADLFVNESTAVRLAQGVGLPVLDLSQPLRERRDEELYQLRDNHFTPRGNAVAAELIADWLRSLGF